MSAWKARLRDGLGELLWRASLTAPRRRLADRLSIATFHRVLPAAERAVYPFPGLVVTPDELDWFVAFFQAHFAVGSLCAVASRWRTGERGGKPLLALTFDDGQLDNFVHAAPVLAARGARATFFVPLDAVVRNETLWHDRIGYGLAALRGGALADLLAKLGIRDLSPALPKLGLTLAVAERAKGLEVPERARWLEAIERAAGPDGARPAWDGVMSFAQLRALADAGHEIGSHSRSHPILLRCSDAELEEEIGGSRARLAEELRAPIDSFCFPNGDCDERSLAAVERAGYRWAVTTRWGSNPRAASPFLLRRCDVQSETACDAQGRLAAARLAWRLSGLHPGLK